MKWSLAYDRRFVIRASAVIGLVFAALVSSWIGIEAERSGKVAVSEVSALARRVFDVSLSAYELDALYDRFVEIAGLPGRTREEAVVRQRYLSTLASIRSELENIGALPLEIRERALLHEARLTLAQYDRIAAAMTASEAGDHREAAPGTHAQNGQSARRVAGLMRELSLEANRRAGRASEEASDAADRARTLLVVFGSVSLMLALYLARWLGDALAKAASLAGRLSEMARIDSLTGLPNRRVWEEELAKGFDRARRTARACTVGLIDLDHFKQFNDTHGHQTGDRLLRETAQALSARMRAGDLIARYGGEEFAVLLHGCDADHALKFFERLHGAMPAGCTFSAGVADTGGSEPAADVLKRADAAMYRAKAEGRDRTEVDRGDAANS